MSTFVTRRFVWIPLQRHLYASVLSAVAMIVLGLFGFAGFPAFQKYSDIGASVHELVLFNAVLLAANYLFLFRQASPSYLRLRQAIFPVLVSLIVLSGAAIGFTLWLAPALASPPRAGTVESSSNAQQRSGSPLPDAPNTEVTRALRVLLVAQGGLSAVILSAGLWKNDDEAVNALARTLTQVRELRTRFLKGITDIGEVRRARRALLFHLDELNDWLDKYKYLVDLGSPKRADELATACLRAKAAATDLDIGAFMIAKPVQKSQLAFLNPIADFT